VAESRQHPRKEVHPPVAFEDPGGSRVEASCSDISLGGMFIQTPTPAAFGSKVKVFLTLPGFKTEVGVEAVVRWTNPEGMGVQFGTMGARETYALTKLLG